MRDQPTGTYWGVPDADVGLAARQAAGAQPPTQLTDAGDGIGVAAVRVPSGSTLGIIEPHFAASTPTRSDAPPADDA